MSNLPSGWETKNLGDCCRISGRIGFRGYTVDDIVSKGQGAISFSPSNISNNKLTYKKCTYLSWEKYEESPEIKIENGDILLVKTGSTFGKTAFVENLPEPATLNPQVVVLKDITVENKFLAYLMAYDTIQRQINTFVVGGAMPTLSQRAVASFVVPLPKCQDEQKKIAEILTSVDKVIELTEIEIEKLKNLKKGMMQDLLTKGIGHTKFKDSPIGKIPESWEVETIGTVGEKFVGGGTPPREVKEYYNGDIPWLTVKDLAENDFYKSTSEEKITKKAIKDSSSNLIEEKNIIVSTRMGLGRGVINTCPMAINQDMRAIYLKKDKITNEFFLQWYKANSEKVIGLGSGSTVKGITLDLLKGINIFLPPINEQNKIVTISSSVDKRTDSLILKLTKLKDMKKGLMQDLLTGKVRVKV